MDFNFNSNQELVYSSDPNFSKSKQKKKEHLEDSTSSIIEVRRETKKRRGKPVITIQNFPNKKSGDFLRELKKICGCGGSNKNGILEIQGDHRDTIIQKLKENGYPYKWTGG